MKRMPKYTAGMFKKKMPRFGASAIRLPRIRKYAEGGVSEEMENEKKVAGFLNQPETMQEKKARELAKKAEKYAPGKDADQQDEDEIVIDPKDTEKNRKAALQEWREEQMKKYMEEQENKRKEKYGLNPVKPTKPKVQTLPYNPSKQKYGTQTLPFDPSKPGGVKPLKRGGMAKSDSHSSHADHVKKNYAVGGFMHHSDHAKKLCGGGYMKGKK